MNRPPLEVADIVPCAGQSFIERSRKWIKGQHEKVLLAITRCRTAALGGHRDQSSDCGHTAISYNSCRNRHCPRCQGNARQRWLQARERELLPASYVHVVFTPRELAPLALQNKRLIYNLLFQIASPILESIQNNRTHVLIWSLARNVDSQSGRVLAERQRLPRRQQVRANYLRIQSAKLQWR